MHGEIRIGGAWRRFAARQVMTTGGFVWAATASVGGLPVVGFDRWTRGSGQMRWRLLGLVPVVRASGPDVTRSAAGRIAGELLPWLPSAALTPAVGWRAVDQTRVTAIVAVAAATHEVTLSVDPDGALRDLVLPRWGDPDAQGWAEHAFGASLSDPVTFDGVTVPTRVVAGWHHGTDREEEGRFIRYAVDAAAFDR